MTGVIDRNFNKETKMRGSLQKLALTFSVLALLAINAAAQCSGKMVYLQLPNSGWGNKTSINLMWDNNLHNNAISATVQGDFSVFTFPNVQNDGTSKTFYFSMKSNDIDNGNSWIASGSRYNIAQNQRPGNNAGFPCSLFGTGNILYIYPDPTNSSISLTNTLPPNAYNFYFLPPPDPEWTLGTPYFVYNDGTNLQYIKLDIDGRRCGWYKKTWFNEPVPNGPGWIWLNRTADDQFGRLGADEDPMDWEDGIATPFNLSEQFNGQPGDLFFAPLNLTPGGMWATTDGSQSGVCAYNFAAIIYDTDKSVNNSFLQDCNTARPDYAPEFGACTNDNPGGVGIIKNIPAPTLAPVDGVMKMQWGNRSGNIDHWTQQNFIDAFKPTQGKNVVRCYDMPFKRNSAGLWEFNSNKLCRNNTMDLDGDCGGGKTGNPGIMGGFFPPMLQPSDPSFDNAAYAAAGCPVATCAKTYHTQGWAPLQNISQFCYDRGRTGTSEGPNINSCGAEFAEGQLANGDTPNIWVWENDRLDSRQNANLMPAKNPHYCFESSPAEFTYEPGQEFFFSGDDDIWVFINNKLAIDLGGTHLAAPGYVNLEAKAGELGLVAGEKYPMNIFFCDRRTTMSNVRITTNMYFAQTNALSVSGGATGADGAKICLESSGSDGGCASVTGGGVGGGSKCGAQMGNILDYYMLNRKGELTELSTSNPACELRGNALVCYGGITLNNYPSVENVVARVGGMHTLMGTYRIYAKINDSEADKFPSATPIQIGQFTVGVNVKPVWGKIYKDGPGGALIYDLGPKLKNVVAGKLVPIGISAGEWRCNEPGNDNAGCGFEALMEPAGAGGALGQRVNGISVFTDPGLGRSALKFYTDSLGNDEVPPGNTFTIPGDGPHAGLLILWVKGEYEAEEDETHTLNSELIVKVFLPRLGFIDPATASTAPARLSAAQKRGSDFSKWTPTIGARDMIVWLGTPLQRAVAAYDISNGSPVLCESCNFRMSPGAWATDNLGGRLDGNPSFGTNTDIIQTAPALVDIVDGIADFSISGVVPVVADTFAFFTVGGRSSNPNTFDQWDSLLFRAPLVPRPTNAYIYDRNGDGIGDSLSVIYNRKFPRVGGVLDSLPNMLLVNWEQDSLLLPFEFGLGQKNSQNQYILPPSATTQANYDYWNNTARSDFKTKVENDSTLAIFDMDFSGDVKTYVIQGPGSIKASVDSWASFIDPEFSNTQAMHLAMSVPSGIEDKIPAIVVKATYYPAEGNCGSRSSKCRDNVKIEVSEAIMPAEGEISTESAETPFAYLLRSVGKSGDQWDAYTELKSRPVITQWAPSLGVRPVGRDSIVNFTYERYTEGTDNSNTPVAGDSVRFVWRDLAGYYALTDLVGNEPNPREIGRRLEGIRPSEIGKIPIATLDPDRDFDKFFEEEVKVCDANNACVNIKNPFNKNKQVEFLPSLETWTADSIRKYYPGFAGQLFVQDVDNTITQILTDKGIDPSTVKPEDITFYASAYYYTNLGTYVVESKPIEIKCDDDRFKIDGQGDCRINNMNVYFAWNLKDSKDRWVGSGAYVEKYTFHWEFIYEENGEKKSSGRLDRKKDKIEMLGVKRIKKKK